jgi:hypothetical protein
MCSSLIAAQAIAARWRPSSDAGFSRCLGQCFWRDFPKSPRLTSKQKASHKPQANAIATKSRASRAQAPFKICSNPAPAFARVIEFLRKITDGRIEHAGRFARKPGAEQSDAASRGALATARRPPRPGGTTVMLYEFSLRAHLLSRIGR